MIFNHNNNNNNSNANKMKYIVFKMEFLLVIRS